MESESKALLEVKPSHPENKIKHITLPYSEKAKRNLKKQQKAYMKKKGQFIRVDHLAGRLLETATVTP